MHTFAIRKRMVAHLSSASVDIQLHWWYDMPSLPSSPDCSVQADDLMKFGNLGKVDGMLHGPDCLMQMKQGRWCR